MSKNPFKWTDVIHTHLKASIFEVKWRILQWSTFDFEDRLFSATFRQGLKCSNHASDKIKTVPLGDKVTIAFTFNPVRWNSTSAPMETWIVWRTLYMNLSPFHFWIVIKRVAGRLKLFRSLYWKMLWFFICLLPKKKIGKIKSLRNHNRYRLCICHIIFGTIICRSLPRRFESSLRSK